MEITQKDYGRNGIFEAKKDNVEVGEMTYAWSGDSVIVIDHTGVNPKYTGSGIGKELVLKAVEFARGKNIKIIPLCPFAKSVFIKNPDIVDVLAS